MKREFPVVYDNQFLKPRDTSTIDWIMENAPWEERTSARYEAFWSTSKSPYTYGQGRGVRTYYPQPWPPMIQAMKDAVEYRVQDLLGMEKAPDFQLCFVNRYDSELQHLGWHADDSPEQDDNMPIVVTSFGAERAIWYRLRDGSGFEPGRIPIGKQKLENGSLFIMLPGMQQTHYHKIPKPGKPTGLRVSLTWRCLK